MKKATARAAVARPGAALRELDLDRMRDSAHRACELLKALANESRLMVLCQLAHGEATVTALQATVGLSQSALSQHLAVLRELGYVQARRSGRSVYYGLKSREAAAVIRTLYQEFCEPGCG
jgi:ArsR family transcriptional regulator, virulence genes transcriptional regulator